MLLFLVGIIAGIVNGYTLFIIKNLLKVQSMILMSNVVGVIPFMVVAAIFCGISAYITKIAQVPAAVGSGIPELKALLSSDFHSSEYPALLSLKIEFTRLLSLIFAMGSGLAIGR
jgi:H+/Cl- antiporter ClcA